MSRRTIGIAVAIGIVVAGGVALAITRWADDEAADDAEHTREDVVEMASTTTSTTTSTGDPATAEELVATVEESTAQVLAAVDDVVAAVGDGDLSGTAAANAADDAQRAIAAAVDLQGYVERNTSRFLAIEGPLGDVTAALDRVVGSLEGLAAPLAQAEHGDDAAAALTTGIDDLRAAAADLQRGTASLPSAAPSTSTAG